MKNILFTMKPKIYILLLAVYAFTLSVAAQETKQIQPVVMVLGSYHMGNPGRDVNNIKADDVLAEKRQKEIADFVALIKKFKPTKIAIEAEPQNTKTSEKYAAYLKGEYALKGDEVDQIAFRLAKELNHPKLFQIDWQGQFDYDKVMAAATANTQTASTEKATAFYKNFTTQMSGLMKTGTVTEILRFMNDEKQVREMHAPYLWTVSVGKDKQYEGADLAADWYERNLKIYANITRITESPNDRILVLIGGGHLKLLQQFISDSGEYDLEKLNKYL